MPKSKFVLVIISWDFVCHKMNSRILKIVFGWLIVKHHYHKATFCRAIVEYYFFIADRLFLVFYLWKWVTILFFDYA